MVKLSSTQILELWERGALRHPLDRALLLLGYARREEPLDRLADVTIGERDQVLLLLRGATFGCEVSSFIDCPECKTHLEFMLDTAALRSEHSVLPVEIDGFRVRRPTSRDLASTVTVSDPAEAVRILAQRCCMVEGTRFPELSTEQVEKIASAIGEADSSADMVLDFSCAECGFTWQTPFDIASFLWREIELKAKQLLAEVHALARAYGWSEREVLELSEPRRKAYIDMVLA